MTAFATAHTFTGTQGAALSPGMHVSAAARQRDPVAAARLTDVALDLGRSPGGAAELMNAVSGQPPGDFLTMLASLLKQGVVGSEILEVRGQRYTSFIDTRIAAPREIAHARRFQESPRPPRINVTA